MTFNLDKFAGKFNTTASDITKQMNTSGFIRKKGDMYRVGYDITTGDKLPYEYNPTEKENENAIKSYMYLKNNFIDENGRTLSDAEKFNVLKNVGIIQSTFNATDSTRGDYKTPGVRINDLTLSEDNLNRVISTPGFENKKFDIYKTIANQASTLEDKQVSTPIRNETAYERNRILGVDTNTSKTNAGTLAAYINPLVKEDMNDKDMDFIYQKAAQGLSVEDINREYEQYLESQYEQPTIETPTAPGETPIVTLPGETPTLIPETPTAPGETRIAPLPGETPTLITETPITPGETPTIQIPVETPTTPIPTTSGIATRNEDAIRRYVDNAIKELGYTISDQEKRDLKDYFISLVRDPNNPKLSAYEIKNLISGEPGYMEQQRQEYVGKVGEELGRQGQQFLQKQALPSIEQSLKRLGGTNRASAASAMGYASESIARQREAQLANVGLDTSMQNVIDQYNQSMQQRNQLMQQYYTSREFAQNQYFNQLGQQQYNKQVAIEDRRRAEDWQNALQMAEKQRTWQMQDIETQRRMQQQQNWFNLFGNIGGSAAGAALGSWRFKK